MICQYLPEEVLTSLVPLPCHVRPSTVGTRGSAGTCPGNTCVFVFIKPVFTLELTVKQKVFKSDKCYKLLVQSQFKVI